MIDSIEDNREAIAALCRQYGVRRLAVFGSAAKGTFDPERSDIDFLVDLGEYDDRVGRRYMRLIIGFGDLLGRRADVVTVRAVKSGWFTRDLDETAQTIHAGDT